MGGERRLHLYLLLMLAAAHRGGAVQAGGRSGETGKLMRSESEDYSAHQRAGVFASIEAHGSVHLAENVSAAQLQVGDCAPCTETKSLVGPMANKVIPDSSISFSSVFENRPDHGNGQAWRVRIDNDNTPWVAGQQNRDQWVSFRLKQKSLVTQIVTRGRARDYAEWVTLYDLYTDGRKYGELRGNSDMHSEVRHQFSPPLVASEVRIMPLEWNGNVAMRAELLGCECVAPAAAVITSDSTTTSTSTTTTTTTTKTTKTTTTTTTTAAATTLSAKSGAKWTHGDCAPMVVVLMALAGALVL